MKDKRKEIVCTNPDCDMYGIAFNPNEGTYFDPIEERDLPFGSDCFKCKRPYTVKR
jgi:hypothetical protein